MTEAAYGDADDSVILNASQDVWAAWAAFEISSFDHLDSTQGTARSSVLNAGAGRRISETEAPFLSTFDQWYLLEPDADRRSALAESIGERNATLIDKRIQSLSTDDIPPVDFVLCKYVLQHVPTTVIRPAVSALESVVRPGGRIALFLATSERRRSRFQIVVPIEHERSVPAGLLRGSRRNEREVVAEISRSTFDELMTNSPDFSFIATHHFGSWGFRRYFPEFAVTRTGPGVAVLEYVRPSGPGQS